MTFWQPRCEGCGRFVPYDGAFSDFRWCDRCLDCFPVNLWPRHRMVDRCEAQRRGWPMWPLSDVIA